MKKIELDRSSFKALSSDTRLKIIKNLNEKDMRVTDLSDNLDLSKPTISEHLNKLEDSGLIEKREERDKKRVYYSLSDKSKSLLEPRMTTRVKLLIGLAILSLAGTMERFYNYFLASDTGEKVSNYAIETAEDSVQASSNVDKLFPWFGVVFLVLTICLIGISVWYYKSRSPILRD